MILLGVNDTGDICGTDINQSKIPEIINTIKQHTSPTIIPEIDLYYINDRNVGVIVVDEYPVKPVACKGRY